MRSCLTPVPRWVWFSYEEGQLESELRYVDNIAYITSENKNNLK